MEDQTDAISESISAFNSEDSGLDLINAYFEGLNQIVLIGWNSEDTFTNCYSSIQDAQTILTNY